MKILVVTNMYPGLDSLYYGIFIKELVEIMRVKQYQVDVFFTNPKHSRAAYFYDVPKLVHLIHSDEYDIIHAQHTYCVFQAKIAKSVVRQSMPLVFTIHEGEAYLPDNQKDPEADFVKRLVYNKTLKYSALRMADFVVSVEQNLPKVVGYQGAYEVIPPGVDTELFYPMDRAECRKRLSMSNTEKIVFFPSSPKRGFNKGVELFKVSLKYLEKHVQVITAGNILHEDMPIYMNAADVIVHTSRFEASPMVIKEAMACNRPAVSTDVGDVRKLFANVPGYFICNNEPHDVARKIMKALDFPNSESGRTRIMELGLSLSQVAQKYDKLYQHIYRTRNGVK